MDESKYGHYKVVAIARAAHRRAPLRTKKNFLFGSIGVFVIASACGFCAYRIRKSERRLHESARELVHATGSGLMHEVRLQLERSVSSTRALSSMVRLDEGAELLSPLGGLVDELIETSRDISDSVFATEGEELGRGEERMQESAKQAAKEKAALMLLVNASKFKFNDVAESIISTYKGISHLELAPHGIVSAVYPMEGHEDAIGFDLFSKEKKKAAMEALRQASTIFTGPELLKNGKMAFFARTPTYIDSMEFTGPVLDYPSWWGFTTTACELDEFFRATPLSKYEDFSVSYVLYSEAKDRKRGMSILSASADVPAQDQGQGQETKKGQEPAQEAAWHAYAESQRPVLVEFEIEDLDVHWVMKVWPREGWPAHSRSFVLQVLQCAFFTMCSLFSLYLVLLRESVVQQVEDILAVGHDRVAPLDLA